jgi:hypothetical protein
MKQHALLIPLLLALTLSTVSAQQFQWQPTEGPTIVGSHISTVTKKNVLFASTFAPIRAIYYSTDEGRTWPAIPIPGNLLFDQYPYSTAPIGYDIRMSPKGTLTLSMNRSNTHGYETFYRTANLGLSWDSVVDEDSNYPTLPHDAWFSNGDVVRTCETCYDVSLSSDEGTTWQRLPIAKAGAYLFSTVINNRDELYLLAGGVSNGLVYDSIFQSKDRGMTWSPVFEPLPMTNVSGTLLFTMSDGSVGLFRYMQNPMGSYGGSCTFSDPSGKNWGTEHIIPIPYFGGLDNAINGYGGFALTKEGEMLILSDSVLYRSKDRGVSWDSSLVLPILTHSQWYSAFTSIVVDSSDVIVIDGDSGLYVSDDERSWISRPIPNSQVNNLAVSPNGTVMALCGWDKNDPYSDTASITVRSSDHGTTWTRFLPGASIPQCPFPQDTGWTTSLAVDTSGNFVVGSTILGKHTSIPFRSKDDGRTWSELPIATSALGFLVVDNDGGYWSNSPYVEHSSDEGGTWDELSTGITNQNIFCLAIAPNGNPFAGSKGTIFRNEQGPVWDKLNTGQHGSYVNTIAVDSNSILYAGTDVEGVLRSTDNGDDWKFINSGLPVTPSSQVTPIHQLLVLPHGIVVAAVDGGIYYLTSKDTIWHNGSTGLLDNNILSLAYHDSLFYAGSQHDGLFKTNISGLEAVASTVKPDDFELSQNYPNPFGPKTQISYNLSQNEFVTLTVLDVLGNVRMLLRIGHEMAGQHWVMLDGSKLSSGVYYYMLETASNRMTRTMVVVK